MKLTFISEHKVNVNEPVSEQCTSRVRQSRVKLINNNNDRKVSSEKSKIPNLLSTTTDNIRRLRLGLREVLP